MTKFMIQLERKLNDGRSKTTAWNVFITLVRLRDLVPCVPNNPPMPEKFNDLRWLTNFADIEDRISKRAKTDHSAHTFYKNILVALNVDGSPEYSSAIDYYRNKFTAVQKSINETYAEHEADEDMLAWEQIIKHRDSMEDKSSMTYLLLCLYTMIPPLRNDFVEMDIVWKESQAVRDDWNYYCVPTRTIHLNAFKTAKSHGSKRILVPDELHDVIGRVRLIKHRKTLDNADGIPMLIGERGKRFSQSDVWRCLTRSFEKPMGPSALRKAYVSQYGETLIAAAQNADAMCHTIGTALKCYVKTK